MENARRWVWWDGTQLDAEEAGADCLLPVFVSASMHFSGLAVDFYLHKPFAWPGFGFDLYKLSEALDDGGRS